MVEKRFKHFTFKLACEQAKRMQAITNHHDYGIFTVLTASMACSDIIRMERGGNEAELCYELPCLDDAQAKGEKQVIQLGVTLNRKMSFKQVLYQVKEQFSQQCINGNTKLETGLEDSNSKIWLGYNAIHDLNMIHKTTKAIQYSFYRLDDKFMCIMRYDREQFSESDITELAEQYLSVFDYVINHPDEPLEEAQEKIVTDAVELDKRMPLDQRIREIARKYPDKTALDYQNEEITYSELLSRANSLAHVLREQGVRQNSIVGVYIDRSIEMVTGILGVLLAGGCYLPLDPAAPKKRVDYILEDSQTEVVVTLSKHNGEFVEKVKTVNVDLLTKNLDEQFIENINDMEDAAYIIYTSGTTGKPKGAILSHENVFDLMYNTQPLFDFSEQDTWVMFHSYSFDFSVWEMYGALFFGGKLVLLPKEYTTDLKKFLDLLREKQVTILNQTPLSFSNVSLAEMKIQDALLKLRYIIFGGDKLIPTMLVPWKNKYPDVTFVNMYGITETCVHVTYKNLSDVDITDGISIIGQALPGVYLQVAETSDEESEWGELYVGGTGVCKGYHHKPELTRERFIDKGYGCVYKSGDLVRKMDNGDFEYKGRGDHQVKIRGFRIELEEINSVLLKHEMIKKAVTTIVEEDDNKHIVSYVVLNSHIELNDIRDYLKTYLQDYMVPSFIYEIDEIPLNVNGKVDYSRLPKIVDIRSQVETEFTEPENEVEETILSIWKEVLNADHIGTSDNFFEIGGNSYKIVICHSQIEEKCGKTFSMSKMFQYPTIKELAEFVLEEEEMTETKEVSKNVEEKINEIDF